MKLVMDHEDLPPQHRLDFQIIYDTILNEALNSKTSACEQSGGKIARKTIAEFEKAGDDFFTMGEVSKLRRASMDRKQKAFLWFFGTFLECVSGKSRWEERSPSSWFQKQKIKLVMVKTCRCKERQGICIADIGELYRQVEIAATRTRSCK
jgi:hypothetical protein